MTSTYLPGEPIDFKFPTRSPFTGVPTTLSGTPSLTCYKANGDTQDSSGITLSVDFDGVTGSNHVHILTSDDPTFYADNSEFDVTIAAGTVDGVSVIGEVVKHFLLRHRVNGTQARTWFVAASGGSDANPGTDPLPLATFAQAVTNCVSGDTIRLPAGAYTVTATYNASAKNGIIIEGDGPLSTVLTGSLSGVAIMQLGNASTVRDLWIANTGTGAGLNVGNSCTIEALFGGWRRGRDELPEFHLLPSAE